MHEWWGRVTDLSCETKVNTMLPNAEKMPPDANISASSLQQIRHSYHILAASSCTKLSSELFQTLTPSSLLNPQNNGPNPNPNPKPTTDLEPWPNRARVGW